MTWNRINVDNTAISIEKPCLDADTVAHFYDTTIQRKYNGEYEFNRWFSTRVAWESWLMTRMSLGAALQGVQFNNVIEVGPGPGTWTTLLFRANPVARFTLVDTSIEMKRQFELEMRAKALIDYRIGDFMAQELPDAFDLFFSCRALEYFADKQAFFNRVFSIVRPKGNFVVVTKNPNCLLLKLRPLKGVIHSTMESPGAIVESARLAGFTNVKVYATGLRLPWVNKFLPGVMPRLHRFLYNKALQPDSPILSIAESVVITGTRGAC